MKNFSTVIFDVDGVLLDSLTPHLQICQDKNKEYGLGLSIPDADAFRNLIRGGVKISPMNFFFEAVGFPPEYAERAFSEYKETFTRDYTLKPFPHINEILSSLHSAGYLLGIVTSNVMSNIKSALGENMNFFDSKCIFTMESSASLSKKESLVSIAKGLAIDAKKLLYVGDQPSDQKAAQEAGVQFLGVTYGWGISKDDKEFPAVDDVESIAKYILE